MIVTLVVIAIAILAKSAIRPLPEVPSKAKLEVELEAISGKENKLVVYHLGGDQLNTDEL